MTSNFTKTVRLGATVIGKSKVSVYAKVEFNDGRLSISGVVGPKSNGDSHGGSGQIVMSMTDSYISSMDYAPGWDEDRVRMFVAIWRKWHLNDMQAGTPEQMAILERHKIEYPGYPVNHYDWACEVLATNGMLSHNGYKYGTAWLKKEVPAAALEFLQNLPDTDINPAWV